MMVSLPPLDLKTMRWAELSAEMSTVSSPASPSMVMVLRRRLVPEKSPMIWMLSPPSVPVAAGIEPVDADFLDRWTEDDPVSRGQGRDVDGIIAGVAVDGDGVEVKAGVGCIEVADDLDRVAGNAAGSTGRYAAWMTSPASADADFLDIVELGDDRCGRREPRGDRTGDDDLVSTWRPGQQRSRDGPPGIDAEGFRCARPGRSRSNVSVPAPPSTYIIAVVSPVALAFQVIVVVSGAAETMSLPVPPTIVSLPSPASIRSLPPPPLMFDTDAGEQMYYRHSR